MKSNLEPEGHQRTTFPDQRKLQCHPNYTCSLIHNKKRSILL